MLLVDCEYENFKALRMFKFEAMWIEHEEYLQTVKEGWELYNGTNSSKVEDLVGRLIKCRSIWSKWGRRVFPNARKLVEQLTLRLEECNARILTAEKKAEVENMIKQIKDARDREEVY